MSRDLIINTQNTTVTIRLDGSSLIVQKTGESGRRFPTRLLNQIIVVGNKLEGLPAVTECAAQQINVFFVSENGDLRARLLSIYARNTDWNEWFDQCLWSQTWLDHYEEVVEQLWSCLIGESLFFRTFRHRHKKHCYEWVARKLNHRWGKSRFRNSRQWLQGFIKILTLNTLSKTGVNASHRFNDRILSDTKNLILLNALIDCCENRITNPIDSPEAVQLFYQEHSKGWHSFLIRFFAALESRFLKMESVIKV